MSEPTFTPEPPPPALDAEAGSATVTPEPSGGSQATAGSEGNTASAAPTLKPDLPHLGITVDERAYHQFQVLAKTVLDSADIASKSAEAAVAVSSEMRQATAHFRDATDTGIKRARLALYILGGVFFLGLVFFITMGVRMVGKINQLDAMMGAVGKRVVELNAGMESLEGVNRSVQALSEKQQALTQSQTQIENRIAESLKQSESMVAKVPGETAKQVAATSDSLLKQVQGINSRLQTQATAVQSLGSEVKALKSNMGNVDALKRDVEALVTLQKERYLETLQKNNTVAARERAVQFPRVPPATSPNAASGPVTAPPVALPPTKAPAAEAASPAPAR